MLVDGGSDFGGDGGDIVDPFCDGIDIHHATTCHNDSRICLVEFPEQRHHILSLIHILIQLKVIQEVITLVVFVGFSSIAFKGESFKWNHALAFLFLVAAVYLVFKK